MKRRLSFLARTSLLVGFFFGLDKVFAFVRTGIISRQFADAVELLDAFHAANNLPDVLFALISGGALSMAFIPLMSEFLTTEGREAAWDLFSRVANLTFLVTAGFAVIITIFAEQIVSSEIGIAPGFDSPEQRLLLSELMRLNLVGTIIFSISGLVMASLQANQHFLLPALAPTMYNIGQIIGAIFFVPLFGIHGLVYGVILGAAMHLLIQVPGLARYGFRWTPTLDLKNTGLVRALILLGPRLLTMGGIQAIVIARDNLASRLDQVGAITSLTLGWMIMQVPETLIGTAVATALLPTLAELATKGTWSSFRQTTERASRVMISLSLPITAVVAAGLQPALVHAVFGLDEAKTLLLTWTARAYMLTLTGYAIQELIVRAFYARKEVWIPFFTVNLRLVLYLSIGILALLLFPHIGAPAIALAELAPSIEAIVLLTLLNRRLIEGVQVGSALLKGMFASLVGGVTAYLVATMLPTHDVIAALTGMFAGGLLSLPIIWKEVRLLTNL